MQRSRVAGLALMVMAGLLILGSCSTTPSAPVSSGTSTTDTKPYGSLTVAGSFGIGQLDPVADMRAFAYAAIGVFDSLYNYDVNAKVIPGIAERWQISDDGLTHTFYIRKGVKFHNGDDLTGADVKFSLERMLAPTTTVSDAPAWRAAVASVELQDDYTVVLRMKSPQWALLGGGGAEGMTSVMPKKYIEQNGVDAFRKALIGSGPFKLVSYTPGTRLELEALESHWRAVPKFKNITILSVPEESTKVAMLKTGELDMAAVTPDSVPVLKTAGLRISSYDAGSQIAAYPLYDIKQPENYAIGNVKVRKALQLAIDSKEIADKLLRGNGTPYAVTMVPSTAYFFDPNVLKPDPFDLEGAKKLLAEAGYPNGFSTTIVDAEPGGLASLLSAICQAVSGYWRKMGVNAEIRAIEYSTFRPKMGARSPETWNTVPIVSATPPRDFDRMANGYHSKKASVGIVNNPKLDELIDKVPNIKDPDERKRTALQAAAMAKNEYVYLAVTGLNMNIAIGSKIGDVALYPAIDITSQMFETITHAK